MHSQHDPELNFILFLKQTSEDEFVNHFSNKSPKEVMHALDIFFNMIGDTHSLHPLKITWDEINVNMKNYNYKKAIDHLNIFGEIYENIRIDKKNKDDTNILHLLIKALDTKIRNFTGLQASVKKQLIYAATGKSLDDLFKPLVDANNIISKKLDELEKNSQEISIDHPSTTEAHDQHAKTTSVGLHFERFNLTYNDVRKLYAIQISVLTDVKNNMNNLKKVGDELLTKDEADITFDRLHEQNLHIKDTIETSLKMLHSISTLLNKDELNALKDQLSHAKENAIIIPYNHDLAVKYELSDVIKDKWQSLDLAQSQTPSMLYHLFTYTGLPAVYAYLTGEPALGAPQILSILSEKVEEDRSLASRVASAIQDGEDLLNILNTNHNKLVEAYKSSLQQSPTQGNEDKPIPATPETINEQKQSHSAFKKFIAKLNTIYQLFKRKISKGSSPVMFADTGSTAEKKISDTDKINATKKKQQFFSSFFKKMNAALNKRRKTTASRKNQIESPHP